MGKEELFKLFAPNFCAIHLGNMTLVMLRGAQKAVRINAIRMQARAGSDVANVKPAFVLKFDPHDDPYFHESLRHPIPSGPRMIVIPEELTVDEQNDLYNMYFGMSIAELSQGTDRWKTSIGCACIYISIALAVSFIIREFIIVKRDPYLRSEEMVKDQIVWQLKTFHDPITGYPSLWDYENNCWKK